MEDFCFAHGGKWTMREPGVGWGCDLPGKIQCSARGCQEMLSLLGADLIRRVFSLHTWQSTLTLAKLEPQWLFFHFGSLPFCLGSLDLKSKTVKPQKNGVGNGSDLVTSS